jgi:hypothetical protein
MIEIILKILIFAISYRIRGGAFNEFVRVKLGKSAGWEIPNGIIRGQWALLVGLTMFLQGLPIIWLPVAIGLAFLGVAQGYRIGKWIGQFDLSRPENRNMRNYAILTARAALILLPNTILGSFFGINMWYAVLASCGFVVYYLIGYQTKWRSQMGEALVGAAIGAAI